MAADMLELVRISHTTEPRTSGQGGCKPVDKSEAQPSAHAGEGEAVNGRAMSRSLMGITKAEEQGSDL